jgi:hypothetical protein
MQSIIGEIEARCHNEYVSTFGVIFSKIYKVRGSPSLNAIRNQLLKDFAKSDDWIKAKRKAKKLGVKKLFLNYSLTQSFGLQNKEDIKND